MPTFPGAVNTALLDGQPAHAADLLGVQRIMVGPAWLNLLSDQFGGVADGSTDNSAALTAAIAALPATGGTIFLPPQASPYVFASAWNFASKSFIRIRGGGPVTGGGSAAGTLVKFTGTSGPLVSAGSSTSLELEDLLVQWPAAFTGTVVDFSGSLLNRISRCLFQATGGGSAAAVIVGLDNAMRAVIERSVFHNAAVGIQGIATAGHSSNVVTIRECNFSSGTPNGDISTAHISNPGQGWRIEGNAFEMGQLAGNCAALTTPLASGFGTKISGNWIGDTGANAVTLLSLGSGAMVEGNYIGGSAASTAMSVVNSAGGVTILGNQLDTHSVGVLLGSSVNRFLYANQRATVTTEISGTPTSGMIVVGGQQTLYGTSTISGTLQLLGAERRSIRGPAFSSPYTPDATVAERTEMTLTGALTVNAPSNGASGQRLEFWWLQDATGGRVVTYNAAYKTTGAAAFVTTASTLTLDVFECAADNTTWRLISRITGQT